MTNLMTAISNLSNNLNEGFGIETVEDALFEIIEMLKEDAALKSQFLGMVERSFADRSPSGLTEGGVPRELVELATHELKWPEFGVLAEKRINDIFGGDESLAISDVANGVKQAYADDWEDREFFKRYAA
jgi:hypothetical protein